MRRGASDQASFLSSVDETFERIAAIHSRCVTEDARNTTFGGAPTPLVEVVTRDRQPRLAPRSKRPIDPCGPQRLVVYEVNDAPACVKKRRPHRTDSLGMIFEGRLVLRAAFRKLA
jgi:hypothetical protein